MKIGFGLITCQRYPGDPRSDSDLYAQALDLAVLAERTGLDSVWVSEHHFVDDGYLPALMPMCAAIAARTQRVDVGTALLLAPLHQPLRLAEDAAVVDLVSRGRLVLGLGLGWREEEFEALHVPLRERAARLEETVAVLRDAWAGQLVTGGAVLPYPGVKVTPGPAQPSGPPLWIGGFSEPAIRRAGRIADGFMATEVSPESLAAQVACARQSRSDAGGDADGLAIAVHLPTFPFAGDAERAWETVRPFHHYVTWKYDDMEVARSRMGSLPSPPSLSEEQEQQLRRGILLGTPEQVAEQIREFDEAAGGELHYIARLYWPGMDPGLQRETIELFAGSVAPLLR